MSRSQRGVFAGVPASGNDERRSRWGVLLRKGGVMIDPPEPRERPTPREPDASAA